MTLLSAGNLGKYYGAELIFQDISFQVARGDKAGPGRREWRRQEHPAQDDRRNRVDRRRYQVAMARGTRVAYLAQEVRFSRRP
jgi:ATP-binding cassette subfamily F protein 3